MTHSLSSKEGTNDSKEEHDAIDSSVDERAVLRKIDIRIIPWLAVLYLLNFLDRGSIGNAKLYNLEEDIGITDRQYLIALTVFFFPYALLEPASNIILRRVRPSIWLSSMMLIWGVVMTLHGVIKDYGGLITVRVLLGTAEAGMYPGIVFFITSWYKRSEMGTRIALFFSSATLAGAFSGLLAAAISNMNGIGGKTGWQWIFILEGLATIILSIVSYWIIPDFPSSPRVKFLTEEERLFVVRRLEDDMKLSAAGESLKRAYIWQSLTDWKTWIAMGIYMGFDGPLYAFSLFTPTIISQLGFRATVANLLSVPVYAWGCFMTCVIGFLGDRIGTRSHINFALFGVGLIAYIILIVSRSPALSYFAVYLAVSAIYPTIPNSVAWVASNVEGSYKRAVTLGMAIGFGNINGAVTANIYRSQDRPWYRLGHGIVLAYIAVGFICSIIFAIYLKRENARRERGERDEVIEGIDNKRAHERNGVYKSVEEAKVAKGDYWSGFRYTL
ncbi:major facilitator superfamily domain-containing protein [Gymnopilus junonius]|uniref:Major facilitator superfamily domain-containing protein n=1 Tax=Gymnopilus junonius TaxID=109634 RepID=A0A9P5TUB9_GYMJU|nr:major facilitator superfamily domain-containing protein [Gymnopilus junonius]